jgi:hypothetical protein
VEVVGAECPTNHSQKHPHFHASVQCLHCNTAVNTSLAWYVCANAETSWMCKLAATSTVVQVQSCWQQQLSHQMCRVCCIKPLAVGVTGEPDLLSVP